MSPLKIKFSFFLLPLILLFALLLNFPSINYYFFQDDWFVLDWVQNSSGPHFLSFRTDIIYWRPLSMPIFFALNKAFFGLNPFYFHILAFSLFFILIISIYFLFKIAFKSERIALLASFLYATWHIHFVSLSWLSTTSYIISPILQVFSFIFFIKFVLNNKSRNIFFSFILFFLALASSELAVMLPFIFLTWGILVKKKNYFKSLIIFFLVDAVYFALRFLIFPIPAKGDYQIHTSLALFSNLIWYLFWGLGLPESFKQLIFISLPAQSFKVVTQFWQITIPVFALVILIATQIFDNFAKNQKQLLFGFSWFLLGIAPVLLLINHSYPMYLSFAGIGMLYLMMTLFKNASLISLGILVFLWSLVSVSTIHFTRLTHWVTNIQSISKSYVFYTKDLVTSPPSGSAFLFKDADQDFSERKRIVLVEGQNNLELALNYDSAIRVIYEDLSLKSFYHKIPKDLTLTTEAKIYEISPRGEDD